MTTPEKPPFNIAQVFTNQATLRHRGDPLSRPAEAPHHPQHINVTMGLATGVSSTGGEATIVNVLVATQPDDGDEKALYDFTVEMVGIVEDIDRTAFDERQLLEVVATILFPFVRETVANLSSRGRFGPVFLNPFNVRGAVQEMPIEETSAAK